MLALLQWAFSGEVLGQSCKILKKGNDIVSISGVCAPVKIGWEVEYELMASGSEVRFRFEWDDGKQETVTVPETAPGTVAGYGKYILLQEHTYLPGLDKCNYEPRVFLEVGGVLCTSSDQAQNITVWDTDDSNGGTISIAPEIYRVCAGNAALVSFRDNSTFNCVPASGEDDVKNDNTRWVRWTYGTQEAGDNRDRIAGILIDGTSRTFPFEDEVETFAGPIEEPGSVSMAITVPATATVGQVFQVKLDNWNQCNPYPGTDPVSNYALILVVPEPFAEFDIKNSNNVSQTKFCPGDLIKFKNKSTLNGATATQYKWKFYNGPDNSYPVTTSNKENPTKIFNDEGIKLIELTIIDASGNTAGTCISTTSKTVEIVSAPKAEIQIIDNFSKSIEFCKDNDDQETVYEVSFINIAHTVQDPENTVYKYEFIDLQEPTNNYTVGPSSEPIPAFVDVPYKNPGAYQVIYSIRNTITNCATSDTARVSIHLRPSADFRLLDDQALCEGGLISFEDLSQEFSSQSGFESDKIKKWRWFFDYGNNPTEFVENEIGGIVSHRYPSPGTYTARLEVETGFDGCGDTNVKEIQVIIKPKPLASFTAPPNACPGFFTFINDSFGNQPPEMNGNVQYFWLITDSVELKTDAILGNNAYFSYPFTNDLQVDKTYYIRLQAVSNGCDTISGFQELVVFPAPVTSFSSDYDPVGPSCSPLTVSFTVDPATQATPDLDGYKWTINDGLGINISPVFKDKTDPAFTYDFINNNGISVQTFTVSLELVLANNASCINPAIQRIKVNPVPVSDFANTKKEETCDLVKINFSARQKGLASYKWSFSETPVNNTILDDDFDLVFERSVDEDDTVQVILETTNLAGCKSGETEVFIIIPKKSAINVALGLVGGDNGCEPFTASFKNLTANYPAGSAFKLQITPAGGTAEIKEDFSGDIEGEFTYLFTEAGEYELRLLATAPEGCTFISPPQAIMVHPAVEANFIAGTFTICSPIPVNFKDESKEPSEIETWNWTITNTTTGDLVDTRTFDTPGEGFDFPFQNPSQITYEFNVHLEVISFNGCTDTISKNITVYPLVQADFEILDEPLCFPYEVSFRNNSVAYNPAGTIFTWYWGDGTYSETADEVVAHTYFNASFDQVKSPTITLRAITPEGCEKITSQTINLNPRVTASMEADQLSGCSPLPVNFNNYSKGDNSPNSGWYFKALDSQDPFFKFSTSKVTTAYTFENESNADKQYEVIYVAENHGGCMDTARTIITVFGILEPKFIVDPVQQMLPNRTVQITNTTFDGPGFEYVWDFGDGTSSTERNPGQHVYETYGNYDITLTTTSSNCERSSTQSIQILPIIPIVDFEGGGQGCGPLTVTFTDKSLYTDPGTYNWNFGDGKGTSTERNPTYTYDEPGIYSVTLSASNAMGTVITARKSMIVEVYAAPRADFQVRPTIVYLPDKPMYTANKSTGADRYVWDFGDGTTSEEFEPTHIYTKEGVYDITLTAINSNGCTDTFRMKNAVIAEDGADVRIPNAFTPALDGPNGGEVGGGGVNDVFLPIMEGVVEFNMLIFNRWGELLFESNSRSKGWDGYFNGKLCQQDVYVYKLNLKFIDGETAVRVGDVTLMR